ncbi:MAG TPA: Rieske 2Fe-2S domain-containing protein [Dehalococcoidia bacterium]|nr:Rieske 2Fe-2S domain-containing protein [Dehalococcoidia bacterium]
MTMTADPGTSRFPDAPPDYRFPIPPFPNGWFQVAYSDELPVNGVMPLEYFGTHLVLWRDAAGAAHVLDAFCPHLGAHLGYGGRVEDGCIRCPFHAWRFNGEGACVEVPYANKIPPLAKLDPWHVCEANGLVMVWHHLGGKAPQWDVPRLAEVGSPGWTDYTRRRWKIRSHNQEMGENAVDSAHFKYVHGTPEQPMTRAEIDGHIFRAKSPVNYTTPQGTVEGGIESTNYGFGFGVVRFTGIVETMLVSSVTPIDGEYMDVRFSFSVKKLGSADATAGVGRAFIAEIERQLGQDIPIWEHKVMKSRPVLCDGDGPIGVYRRWCKQFYSADAPPAGTDGAADEG